MPVQGRWARGKLDRAIAADNARCSACSTGFCHWVQAVANEEIARHTEEIDPTPPSRCARSSVDRALASGASARSRGDGQGSLFAAEVCRDVISTGPGFGHRYR